MRDARADLRAVFERAKRDSRSRDSSQALAARARRARRQRLASLAVLGALVATGAGAGAWAAISEGLRPDVVTLGYATLPFVDPGEADPPLIDPAIASCGAPAPETVTAGDTLSLTEESWSEPGPGFEDIDAASYRAYLAESESSPLPLALSPLAFIFVQDGAVVGWAGNRSNPSEAAFHSIRAGLPVAVSGDVFAADQHCEDGVPVLGNLPSGDYEVYPVLRATASPETAARELLARQGYAVPSEGQGDSPLLVAGSWDCESGQGETRNVLCAPGRVEGVTIDREAESLSAAYDSSVYVRDLDVTLVGEPTPFSVRSSSAGAYRRDRMLPAIPAAPDAMRCSALLREAPSDATTLGSDYPIEAAAVRSLSRTKQGSGGTVQVAILPADGDATEVAYAEGLSVWLVGWTGVPAGRGKLAAVRQVVATATATVAEGEPIALHRFLGASQATVTLSDVEWCPGGATGELGGIVIAGPETVTSAGATTTTERFTTWPVGLGSFGDLTWD